MSYSTLQNTPITIDLKEASKTTGWSIYGDRAAHESCNAGYMVFKNLLEVGKQYRITMQIESIANGYVKIELGNDESAHLDEAKFYDDILLTSSTDGELRIYSNADCVIRLFTYQLTEIINNPKQQKTIRFRNSTNKWVSFLTYNPDIGNSLFNNTYLYKGGNMYIQKNQNPSRNILFGKEYPSMIKFVATRDNTMPKTFQSLAYESNMLLITTEDGITTSLGQVSELIDIDFLKDTLTSGVDEIKIYDSEGVYSASFMKDKNVDIINGDDLKGTHITIELTTVNSGALELKNVQVNSIPSRIGVR